MKKVGIAELKDRLSYYLRFVRRGQSVLVYDRDQPIARIDPVPGGGAMGAGTDWPDELERLGLLRAPTAALPSDWLRHRDQIKADVVKALLDERESGR